MLTNIFHGSDGRPKVQNWVIKANVINSNLMAFKALQIENFGVISMYIYTDCEGINVRNVSKFDSEQMRTLFRNNTDVILGYCHMESPFAANLQKHEQNLVLG